jgi:hypothetical protein
MDKNKRKRGSDRTGCQNKSTAVIKELVQSNVDFPALIRKLAIRAMKNDTQAAKILFEYGFGKAPQPLEHTGSIGVKVIRDNI